MEEHNQDNQDNQDSSGNDFKAWLQDNLRIIVSVAIVILIAAGIYSYSQRTEIATQNGEESSQEEVFVEGDDELVEVEVEGEIGAEGEVAEGESNGEVSSEASETENEATPVAISRETESSFVETAKAGDGQTHLARRALANYLEKNPDSSLTKEHKIYIEDYLRKTEGFDEPVYVGTSVEYSKDHIRQAIERSKSLTERQLQNLQKYSARVTSL